MRAQWIYLLCLAASFKAPVDNEDETPNSRYHVAQPPGSEPFPEEPTAYEKKVDYDKPHQMSGWEKELYGERIETGSARMMAIPDGLVKNPDPEKYDFIAKNEELLPGNTAPTKLAYNREDLELADEAAELMNNEEEWIMPKNPKYRAAMLSEVNADAQAATKANSGSEAEFLTEPETPLWRTAGFDLVHLSPWQVAMEAPDIGPMWDIPFWWPAEGHYFRIMEPTAGQICGCDTGTKNYYWCGLFDLHKGWTPIMVKNLTYLQAEWPYARVTNNIGVKQKQMYCGFKRTTYQPGGFYRAGGFWTLWAGQDGWRQSPGTLVFIWDEHSVPFVCFLEVSGLIECKTAKCSDCPEKKRWPTGFYYEGYPCDPKVEDHACTWGPNRLPVIGGIGWTQELFWNQRYMADQYNVLARLGITTAPPTPVINPRPDLINWYMHYTTNEERWAAWLDVALPIQLIYFLYMMTEM